jgi:membrane protein implicated in regulation of membrane protease activity
MTITILVGSIWGHPALVFVHSYIGILIFVAFVTVFWLLIVRWLDKVEKRQEPSAEIQAVSKPQEA